MKYTFLKYTLGLFILFFIVTEIMIYFGGRSTYNSDAKYIIVLGAKLHGDRPSKSLKYRMDVALKIMNNNKNIKLIASGGKGEDEKIPEAHAIRDYFINNGISEDRIIVEDKSTNTFENLSFSLNLIPEKENVAINIVSNRYHLLRSKILAKRVSFVPYSVPARTPKTVLFKSYIREFVALYKSLLLDN